MKKVRVFRNWTPSKPCDFDYKDFKIVHDDSYDYAVILNTPNVKLKPIPKNRVFGMAWEPHAFCDYYKYANFANTHCGRYVIGDPRNLGPAFVEGHSFMYDFRAQEFNFEKKHPICLIASTKKQLQGHKLRHSLIQQLLKTNMDIHIYGRGIDSIFKDSRIKGGFGWHNDVYPSYHFDISIENCKEGSYITEKLFNPLAYHCCPLYWGVR